MWWYIIDGSDVWQGFIASLIPNTSWTKGQQVRVMTITGVDGSLQMKGKQVYNH